MGGGFVWGQCMSFVGGGLMFMGGDRLVGGGCRSGMGAAFLLCCRGTVSFV